MIPSLLDQQPLTPAALDLKELILSIPRTSEPIHDDLPPEITEEDISHLHALAVQGSQQAAPEIRKALARHPQFSMLLNYLYVAHSLRGEIRQAEATLKKMAEEHPEYLFTRINLANKALHKDQHEKAAAQLPLALDLRTLYPERDQFHLTELTCYYQAAARILARKGDPDLALGILAALDEIQPDPEVTKVIELEVMTSRLKTAKQILEDDEKRKICNRQNPLPKALSPASPPTFRHPQIAELYEYDVVEIPNALIEEILALPRETLVADLIAVLQDCKERTPNFMQGEVPEFDNFALFHAIHLLAEVEGHEATEALLDVLSLHSDAIEFWLGGYEISPPQITRIVAGNLPACFTWLRAPGINSFHKEMVITAIEEFAKTEDHRLAEISQEWQKLLAFLIDSPPEDNILDSILVAVVIHSLIKLRAVESLPIIRSVYEKNLVQLFIIGSYQDLAVEMEQPMEPAVDRLPIIEEYDSYQDQIEDEYWEEKIDDDIDFPYLPQHRPPSRDSNDFAPFPSLPSLSPATPAESVGRNDPCPCGSGLKYKKCCLK